MDAIKKLGLIFSPNKNSFSFETATVNSVQLPPTALAPISLVQTVKIPPLTSVSVSVSTISDSPYRPPSGSLGLAHIGTVLISF